MTKKFNPTEYKKRNMQVWNEVAPRYHKRWASTHMGPFSITKELIKLAKIRKDDKILDIASGTGVVTKEIVSKISSNGFVVGIDSSKTAIDIARRSNGKKRNLDFVLADAESVKFKEIFDVVTCQYALFFFPNARKALVNAKKFLKKDGTLAIAVHGIDVPFFNSILDAVTEFIPDYIPQGVPDLDRFGTKKSLSNVVKKAGFSKISVKEFTFTYSPGTFSDYWENYLKYIAKPLKEKLNKLSSQKRKQVRELAKKNCEPYTKKNGEIIFPWQVLLLTAKK